MAADWDFYLCNVNDALASIFLDLSLRTSAPDRSRPFLVWIWVYMKHPRQDGLSDSFEFAQLKAIEDELGQAMVDIFDSIVCGRITTAGRREFYYYAKTSENLEATTKRVMHQFPGYGFDCGTKPDPGWRQYVDVLYPSDEEHQRLQNRRVLAILEERKDSLKAPRDVHHWAYFRTKADRERFQAALATLQYRVESQPGITKGEFPFGVSFSRFQHVRPADIDEAVLELFRLVKQHDGEYDGWETQVIPG